MYSKGEKIYDSGGRLYATLRVDVKFNDPIFVEQFEFHQSFLKPVEDGDPIPDPIWKFAIGEPYKPKD